MNNRSFFGVVIFWKEFSIIVTQNPIKIFTIKQIAVLLSNSVIHCKWNLIRQEEHIVITELSKNPLSQRLYLKDSFALSSLYMQINSLIYSYY